MFLILATFSLLNTDCTSLQNPPEKEIDAQGTSVTNKKDRKKEKAKDGKKEGSDDNENGDDYGMFPLQTFKTVKLITFGIRKLYCIQFDSCHLSTASFTS